MLIALVALALGAAPTRPTPPTVNAWEEKPFPLKTVTLKTDGEHWFVRGRMQIANNQKVVSLRATTITGIGDDATLVVSGELEMRAVTGGLVVLDNVAIELAPDFKSLSLMNCTLKGKGGVISAPNQRHEGQLYVSAQFEGETRVALRMSGGTAAFSGCKFSAPITVLGIERSKDLPSQLAFGMLGCKGESGGVLAGIRIEGIKECNLANDDFGGAECVLADIEKLKLYGNNIRAARFELRQSKPGRFGGTKIEADDFRTKHIALVAPPKNGAPERLAFNTCWFGGSVDEKAIKSDLFEDAAKDPKVGVTAALEKISPSAFGFGGDRP